MKPVPRRESTASTIPLSIAQTARAPPAPLAPTQCRYCARDFGSTDGAETHLRELAKAGMLLDHIAIHGPAAAAW